VPTSDSLLCRTLESTALSTLGQPALDSSATPSESTALPAAGSELQEVSPKSQLANVAGRIFAAALRRLSQPEGLQQHIYDLDCAEIADRSHDIGGKLGPSGNIGSSCENFERSNRICNSDGLSGFLTAGNELGVQCVDSTTEIAQQLRQKAVGNQWDGSPGAVQVYGYCDYEDRQRAANPQKDRKRGSPLVNDLETNAQSRLKERSLRRVTATVDSLWQSRACRQQDQFQISDSALSASGRVWVKGENSSSVSSIALRTKQGRLPVECDRLGAAMCEVWGSAEEAFVFLDGGSNDVLTRAELRSGAARLRVPGLQMDRLLVELDSDRTGLVTVRIFVRKFANYWGSSMQHPQAYEAARRRRGEILARFNAWCVRHMEAAVAEVDNAGGNAAESDVNKTKRVLRDERVGPRSPPATPDPETAALCPGLEGSEAGEVLGSNDSNKTGSELTGSSANGEQRLDRKASHTWNSCDTVTVVDTAAASVQVEHATMTVSTLPRHHQNCCGRENLDQNQGRCTVCSSSEDSNMQHLNKCERSRIDRHQKFIISACLFGSENVKKRNGSHSDAEIRLQIALHERSVHETRHQAKRRLTKVRKDATEEEEQRRLAAALRHIATEEDRKIRRRGLQLPCAVDGDWSGLRLFRQEIEISDPLNGNGAAQVPIWTANVDPADLKMQCSCQEESTGED
jgi:hypothetical protein